MTVLTPSLHTPKVTTQRTSMIRLSTAGQLSTTGQLPKPAVAMPKVWKPPAGDDTQDKRLKDGV